MTLSPCLPPIRARCWPILLPPTRKSLSLYLAATRVRRKPSAPLTITLTGTPLRRLPFLATPMTLSPCLPPIRARCWPILLPPTRKSLSPYLAATRVRRKLRGPLTITSMGMRLRRLPSLSTPMTLSHYLPPIRARCWLILLPPTRKSLSHYSPATRVRRKLRGPLTITLTAMRLRRPLFLATPMTLSPYLPPIRARCWLHPAPPTRKSLLLYSPATRVRRKLRGPLTITLTGTPLRPPPFLA